MSKLKLRDVLKMLKDKNGWRPVRGRVFRDEITYRDTGIYIYADCNCATVRRFNDLTTEFPHLDSNVQDVYRPNVFAFILTSVYTALLRHHLRRIESMKPCASSTENNK